MEHINISKIKRYTRDRLKYFNIALLTFGFIVAIILLKYKPMYEVKISGEQVGYLETKSALDEVIEENIETYSSKIIDNVELTESPELQLKLVEKNQESNESEITAALQKELDITYKSYEIIYNDEVIDSVDSMEKAEQIVNEIKEKNSDIELTINKKVTKNIEEITTNTVEVAKENIIKKLGLDELEAISDINGIKIATLPVTGSISSRYGVSSKIRVSTHTGLDIAASRGTPIKAIADGTVTFASYSGSYGNLVKIDHGNGVESWYAHASKINVKVGQEIKAGDIIATVGSTGNSTGPHLHLEIRINGNHVNPQKYIYK